MKKYLLHLSYLSIALALVFSSCNNDDDVNPEQEALNALNGQWTINSATTPDGPIDPIAGVTVTFNSENTTYAVSGLDVLTDNKLNYSNIFAASGSFSLNSTQTSIVFESGGSVNYTIDGDNLTLSYESNFPKPTDEASTITLSASR